VTLWRCSTKRWRASSPDSAFEGPERIARGGAPSHAGAEREVRSRPGVTGGDATFPMGIWGPMRRGVGPVCAVTGQEEAICRASETA
jgi:hypothetical protein